jgi:hypothetical protein
MNTSPYHTVSFGVKKEDVRSFNKKLETLVLYTCAKRDIPYLLFDKFINLITTIEQVKNDRYVDAYLNVAAKATDYFKYSANGIYNFEGTTKIKKEEIFIPSKEFFKNGEVIPEYRRTITKNGKIVYKTYSLQDLFLKCSQKYYLLLENKKYQLNKPNKDETLRLFYVEIKEYRDSLFTKKHKSECNHYRMAVMSAYLTHLIEYKASTKKKFTNADLFQFSKNALKGLK